MKHIIMISILSMAFTGCASINIDIGVSEYTPRTQYCYDGISGEVDKFKSNVNMTALVSNEGMLYYVPADEIKECE